uniref:Putative secreted protein n=1 Tax=Anopheles darlingi TaxID=43151 RepID=A0A2M4DDJ7_ANODA
MLTVTASTGAAAAAAAAGGGRSIIIEHCDAVIIDVGAVGCDAAGGFAHGFHSSNLRTFNLCHIFSHIYTRVGTAANKQVITNCRLKKRCTR